MELKELDKKLEQKEVYVYYKLYECSLAPAYLCSCSNYAMYPWLPLVIEFIGDF